MSWLFSKKPKSNTKEYWLTWAEKQRKQGQPLQKLWKELLDNPLSSKTPVDIVRAKHQAANDIQDIMVQRNLEGERLEKAGQVSEAVALYEENVRDKFSGRRPYERLRAIYTKQGQRNDAIRVCKAFLALPGRERAVKFLNWLKELEEVQ